MSRKARAASRMRGGHGAGRQRLFHNGDEHVLWPARAAGILPVIPKTQTSGNAKRGLFHPWRTLIYDAENDRYTCSPPEST